MHPKYVRTLAALRDGRPRDPTVLARPREVHVADTYADRVRLVIPGSQPLARALVVPYLAESAEVFTLDGLLMTRTPGETGPPRPVAVESLADELVACLLALPELSDAANPYYRTLRRLAELDPTRCREVVLDAIQVGAPRVVRLYKPPTPQSDRPAALTPAERKRAERLRTADAEATSVAAFVAFYLSADGAPAPGERLAAPALYDAAFDWIADASMDRDDARDAARAYVEDLADYRARIRVRKDTERRGGTLGRAPEPPEAPDKTWDEIATAKGYPPRPALPSRQRFFKLADDVLGPRRRTHGATYYTAPEASVNLSNLNAEATAYREAAEEGERLLRVRGLLAAGQPAAALTLQREALAATQSDGIADLDAYRTLRRA